MPRVEVDVTLDVPIAEVWRLVRDVEAYPRLMQPVREVRILESTENELLTFWEVELKGSILRWTEREWHREAEFEIRYQQEDGDLETFDGYWRLFSLPDGATRVTFVVDFEIGIPMLKDMLDPVAERAIRQNARAMLLSLGPAKDES